MSIYLVCGVIFGNEKRVRPLKAFESEEEAHEFARNCRAHEDKWGEYARAGKTDQWSAEHPSGLMVPCLDTYEVSPLDFVRISK